MIAPLSTLVRCETALQHFTSAAVTFATADNSIAATGIGTAFPTVGTKIVITGAGESGNNTTFTIKTVSSTGKIIVTETVTAEAAGATVVANEKFYSDWQYVSDRKTLAVSAYASQACTVYVEQANDAENVDHTTTFSLVAAQSVSYEIDRVQNYARLAILNGGVDQTALRVILNAGVI